jgi:hypothetical protein
MARRIALSESRGKPWGHGFDFRGGLFEIEVK